MKNSEYWKERFTLLEESQHRQGVQCYAELEKQYDPFGVHKKTPTDPNNPADDPTQGGDE